MKKYMIILFPLIIISFLASCEFFSRPVYTLSRDITGTIGSMSTEDLAGNIDKFSSDPEKVADVLSELADRDQDEVKKLPRDEKEKLLEAGVGVILPTSQLGETVDQLTSGEGEKDYKKIMDTLTSNSPDVDTKALETVLGDEDVLENTDATTLTLGAASLITNTIKKEGGDEKMDAFQEAVKGATTGGTFDESTFKKQLEEKGFSADSVSALTTAMNTTSVLTGTAGEGKPNRKEDTEKISVGGFSLGGLLDDLTGKES